MKDTPLRDRLIELYRESIAERYEWKAIKDDARLPKALDQRQADDLRRFFLDNLYAAPAQRARLDAAFSQLESYVRQPQKIWGILGNLAGALLQFGMHFPAALKAGMATLETHAAARKLEGALLDAAQKKKLTAEMTKEEFTGCLATLDQAVTERFIADLSQLFMVISDAVMLDKTLHILNNVLDRMKSKPDMYGTEDTSAIQLGIDVLTQGKELLAPFDFETKKGLIAFIQYHELAFLASLKKN
ncbi:MAG: hypothetical protein U0T84_10035 [Chitinophagales bacterium]